MRPLVSLLEPGVHESLQVHLEQHFGNGLFAYMGGCASCQTPAPSMGKRFEVLEPLETCVSSVVLPVGIYQVDGAEEGYSSGHPHLLRLRQAGGMAVQIAYADAQYASSPYRCIDWRAVIARQDIPHSDFLPPRITIPRLRS